jgi:hypothetical protein
MLNLHPVVLAVSKKIAFWCHGCVTPEAHWATLAQKQQMMRRFRQAASYWPGLEGTWLCGHPIK